MLALLLSGERARLRVDVVEAMRVWGGAPGGNEEIEEVNLNVCLLEPMVYSRSSAAAEARVAGLLRVVGMVVAVGVEDVADGGTDTEAICVKKSVNFLLFLSLREVFARILKVG